MTEQPPADDNQPCLPRSIEVRDAFELSAQRAQIDALIVDLRRQLKADADAGRLWERVGILELAREQQEAALWALEMASLLQPLSHRGQLALAECYVKAGFVESAKAIYQHLAAAIRLETDILEDLAAGLGRVGEPELALAVCREAADRMPNTAGPLLGIVHYLRRLRRPAATVLPYLKQAFELDPSDTECRISLAWILHTCGRSEDGANLLDTVPLAELECVRSLTVMRRVFEAVADEHCATVCKYRLEAIAAQRWRERP
jgi:thioredoxin-like negative regulator of GroEL